MLREKAGWRSENLVGRSNHDELYDFLVPAYCFVFHPGWDAFMVKYK